MNVGYKSLMLCAIDHSHAHLSYMQQDSVLTLAEGLKEYYAANAGRLVCPQDWPPEFRPLSLPPNRRGK